VLPDRLPAGRLRPYRFLRFVMIACSPAPRV
jgi:hypothetical protein